MVLRAGFLIKVIINLMTGYDALPHKSTRIDVVIYSRQNKIHSVFGFFIYCPFNEKINTHRQY